MSNDTSDDEPSLRCDVCGRKTDHDEHVVDIEEGADAVCLADCTGEAVCMECASTILRAFVMLTSDVGSPVAALRWVKHFVTSEDAKNG